MTTNKFAELCKENIELLTNETFYMTQIMGFVWPVEDWIKLRNDPQRIRQLVFCAIRRSLDQLSKQEAFSQSPELEQIFYALNCSCLDYIKLQIRTLQNHDSREPDFFLPFSDLIKLSEENRDTVKRVINSLLADEDNGVH